MKTKIGVEMRKFNILIIMIVFILPYIALSQESEDPGRDEKTGVQLDLKPSKNKHFREYYGAIERTIDTNTFSGNIVVGRGNTVMANSSFGFANEEWQVPNSAYSLFNIGQIAELYGAYIAIKLAGEGLINFDDYITKYLSNMPGFASNIKIEHLLNHTSGLPCPLDNPKFWPDSLGFDITSEYLLSNIYASSKPATEPGNKYYPSCSDYFLLMHVLSNAAGKDPMYLTAFNVIKPNRLTTTRFIDAPAIINKKSYGYNIFDNRPRPAYDISTLNLMGFGNIYSNGRELFDFSREFFKSGFLSDSSKALIYQTDVETEFGKAGYGIQMKKHEIKGKAETIYYKEGWLEGYSSALVYLPSKDYTVVLLSNRSNYPAVEKAIEIISKLR